MKTAAVICAIEGDNYVSRKFYTEMLGDFGFSVILLPVGSKFDLTQLELLVLAGGGDLHSSLFGAKIISELRHIDTARDFYEIKQCKSAIKNNIPILAICRGMQVLNVALGGDLIQHLTGSRLQTHDGNNHQVQITDTAYANIIGGTVFSVNSYHHQAVGKIGFGLKPFLHSVDGITEGLISSSGKPLLGLQFHPERIYQKNNAVYKILADFFTGI